MKYVLTTIKKLVFIVSLACFSQITSAEKNRLVSTYSGATELVFALQQQQKLVAIDVTSQLPENYPALPNIGYHRNLSAEGVLALKPDLLIGSEHIGPATAINALEKAGVSILQLPGAQTLDQLKSNIQQLASALDQSAQGQQLIAQLDQQYQQIISQQTVDISIAFLLSMGGEKLRLAGSDTSAAAFIQLLGGNNVADFKNYRSVSAESLLAMQPDLILIAAADPKKAVADFLNANPVFKHSAANSTSSQQQQILALDASALVSGLSLKAMTEALAIQQQLAVQLAAN